MHWANCTRGRGGAGGQVTPPDSLHAAARPADGPTLPSACHQACAAHQAARRGAQLVESAEGGGVGKGGHQVVLACRGGEDRGHGPNGRLVGAGRVRSMLQGVRASLEGAPAPAPAPACIPCGRANQHAARPDQARPCFLTAVDSVLADGLADGGGVGQLAALRLRVAGALVAGLVRQALVQDLGGVHLMQATTRHRQGGSKQSGFGRSKQPAAAAIPQASGQRCRRPLASLWAPPPHHAHPAQSIGARGCDAAALGQQDGGGAGAHKAHGAVGHGAQRKLAGAAGPLGGLGGGVLAQGPGGVAASGCKGCVASQPGQRGVAVGGAACACRRQAPRPGR